MSGMSGLPGRDYFTSRRSSGAAPSLGAYYSTRRGSEAAAPRDYYPSERSDRHREPSLGAYYSTMRGSTSRAYEGPSYTSQGLYEPTPRRSSHSNREWLLQQPAELRYPSSSQRSSSGWGSTSFDQGSSHRRSSHSSHSYADPYASRSSHSYGDPYASRFSRPSAYLSHSSRDYDTQSGRTTSRSSFGELGMHPRGYLPERNPSFFDRRNPSTDLYSRRSTSSRPWRD